LNFEGVERGEAEAIYDSGRERCVEFVLQLACRAPGSDRTLD
jgi:hypothetical protein